MHVLVAYASRHGATQGIAEHIAETLRAAEIDAEAKPAASIRSLAGYDAFVVRYSARTVDPAARSRPDRPGRRSVQLSSKRPAQLDVVQVMIA